MSDPTVIQTKVFAAIMELLGEKSLSIADKTRLIGDGGGWTLWNWTKAKQDYHQACRLC